MTPTVTLSKLMAAGAQLSNQGKWEDAIAIFQRCLKANPKYIDALYNLGVCYANIGDFNQSLQYYQQVLKLNSMDLEATYNCGVAYGQLGDLSKAIEAYQRALEIDERYLAAWVNLAESYYTRGLELLKKPYEKVSGETIPAGENLHTYFSITSWSDEGLEFVRQALKGTSIVVDDFQLAAECFEEAIKRADNPSLKTDLEYRVKILKTFGACS